VIVRHGAASRCIGAIGAAPIGARHRTHRSPGVEASVPLVPRHRSALIGTVPTPPSAGRIDADRVRAPEADVGKYAVA